jgi:hypothetical protein
MNLGDYANTVQQSSLANVSVQAQPLWQRAYDVIGNESRTDPTVASLLSDIVLCTDEFLNALKLRSLDPSAVSGREVMLLNRSQWGEYVLLIADEHLSGNGLLDEENLLLPQPSLERALERWQRSRVQNHPRTQSKLDDFYQNISAEDLKGINTFPIHFTKRPRLIPTSAPSPAWQVTSDTVSGRASVGCIVASRHGHRTGVTTVRHFFPKGAIKDMEVDVDGRKGVVKGEDLMSDSVFIQLTFSPGEHLSVRATKGWLQGEAPRLGALAAFDGATSQHVVTAVSAQDPGVTHYSQYTQSRVYTQAVTNPGDSGAALIEESTDLIIGFAKDRTEAGALIEWSSWIWADSVFTALDVQPQ